MTDETFAKIKSQLKFDAQGLIPSIIQDQKTQKAESAARARAAGLIVVEDRCLLKEHAAMERRSQNSAS